MKVNIVAAFPAIVLSLSECAHALPNKSGQGDHAHAKGENWSLKQFKNLIVFGDSYSDENQFQYFVTHKGSHPPVGTLLPESHATADGGRVWPRYVVQYTNHTTNLHNYASAGACCSNKITPRYLPLTNSPFPDLDSYEVPRFLADKRKNTNIATGGPLFTPALSESNAVYTFFTGGNDIGVDAFFTDSQLPGKIPSDYIDCVFAQMDRVYEAGARYFVIVNLPPFQLAPLYANRSAGGVEETPKFWPGKPGNLTAIGRKMEGFVDMLNTVYEYRTPYETQVACRYPGAKVTLFDINKLFLDIYTQPTKYLNGTTPPNVHKFINHCNDPKNPQDCKRQPGDPDSYFWFDELHPSEQVERVVAREFTEILGGKSRTVFASVALTALTLVSSSTATAIPNSLTTRDEKITTGSTLPFPTYPGLSDTNQDFCNSDEASAPSFNATMDLLTYFSRDGAEVAADPNKYLGEGKPNICTVSLIVNGARLSMCNPTADPTLISQDDLRVSLKMHAWNCLTEDKDAPKFLGGAFKIWRLGADKETEDPERKDYLLLDRDDMTPAPGAAEAQFDQKPVEGENTKSEFEKAAATDDSKSDEDREAQFDKGG
ncbi:MAG: hypothetical protein M1831_003524 [Alyxoria varia]|nr:MAG: hypothetical protein M1831_003524 [Alyxoria varia]